MSTQIIFMKKMNSCTGCSAMFEKLKKVEGTNFMLCEECLDPLSENVAECCGRISSNLRLTEIDGEAFWLCQNHDSPAYKDRCECGQNFKACTKKPIVCENCRQVCCEEPKCSDGFLIVSGNTECCRMCKE